MAPGAFLSVKKETRLPLDTAPAGASSIISDLTVYQNYAKHLPQENRRETYAEVVTRGKEMHQRKFPQLHSEIEEAFKSVYKKEVFQSMRAAQFSGKAIERNNSRIFNCCYCPVDSVEAFSETIYLLLGGSGVGYSVQPQHIAKLPPISLPTRTKKFYVQDDIEGWADAVKAIVGAYLNPEQDWLPDFDFSLIRAKGAPLRTTGGKAPGPEPIKLALTNISNLLGIKEEGSRLKSIEAHDIQCFSSDSVMAGGIRRAAMIVLFSIKDEDMMGAKGNFEVLNTVEFHPKTPGNYLVTYSDPGYGVKTQQVYLSEEQLAELLKKKTLPWYLFQPQRGRANNSALILRGSISKRKFNKTWKKIESSGSGEPAIIWTNDLEWGFNPCVEAALPPYTFCNLTTISCQACTTQEKFNQLAGTAAFIGTLQASYTDFKYLRPIWKEMTEQEALLGVSLTGVANESFLALDECTAALRAVQSNQSTAKLIGINPAARVTNIKPEGKTSLVAVPQEPSGIHAFHGEFYITNRMVSKITPLFAYLNEKLPGLLRDNPYSPELEALITIPVKGAPGVITRSEPVIDLLERIKRYNKNWIEAGHQRGVNRHNVSATVTIRPGEWEMVGLWLWENREAYSGISVLPEDGGTYLYTPNQDCSEEEYERLSALATQVDLREVYEPADETELSQELACSGGACSI